MGKYSRPDFLGAAKAVLARSRHPLSCKQIVDRASEAGLLVTRSEKPENTLHSLLSRHIERQGTKATFVKVGRGRFALRGHAEPNID